MLGSPRRALFALLAAALAGTLGIAACGSGEKQLRPSAATSSAAGSASGRSKPTLIVYSAQGYSPNGVEAFTKETGVPAKLVENSTGPLLTRIQAEKADPQWGLLWVDGNAAFALLDSEGQLEKGLSIPALTATGLKFVPSDRSFVPTGITMACTAIYDSKTLSRPPTSWQQLLESRFKGKVGMNNPAVSGPTFPCVAGLMEHLGGEAQGKAFLERLKANGLHVSETNGDTLHLLETGQIQVGLIQSSAAIGAAEKVPGLKVDYLPKLAMLPSVIGVDAHVSPPIQEEAKRFIDWVLSPAGQHQMQVGDPHGDSLYWPVAPSTKPLPALPELSTLSTQTLDPYKWGELESSVNSWFGEHVAQ